MRVESIIVTLMLLAVIWYGIKVIEKEVNQNRELKERLAELEQKKSEIKKTS